jgi:hypothetical protein
MRKMKTYKEKVGTYLGWKSGGEIFRVSVRLVTGKEHQRGFAIRRTRMVTSVWGWS